MVGMKIFDSKPALRWLAPVAALALVGGSGLVAATATAGDKLPDRSAEQLLVDLQQTKVDGLSGTVVQRANLGIPAIPGAGDATSATSMLSGTHTLRVWYSDPNKARVALVGTYGESDLVTNGTDVWSWSSKDQTATHRTMPAGAHRPGDAPQSPAGAPKTPQEAAQWALQALGSSTDVNTNSDVTIAGEKAYELVLRPKTGDSLLTEARVAIDGNTHVPLRVQAFAGDQLVFEVAYQSVSFVKPDNAQFDFNPPAGTTVTEVAPEPKERSAPSKAEQKQAKERVAAQRDQTRTVGTGWSTVVVTKASGATTGGNDQLQGFLRQLEPVSGSWGTGRLLRGTAFSAVLTDDGRVAVGAVAPELLYKALEK